MNFLKKLIRDEEGQSTTEYILILAVVVMIAMKFGGTMKSKMTSMTTQLGGKFDDALSGKFDEGG